MANQHQTTGHTAGKLCGGLWAERNEVLNIRMEEGELVESAAVLGSSPRKASGTGVWRGEGVFR